MNLTYFFPTDGRMSFTIFCIFLEIKNRGKTTIKLWLKRFQPEKKKNQKKEVSFQLWIVILLNDLCTCSSHFCYIATSCALYQRHQIFFSWKMCKQSFIEKAENPVWAKLGRYFIKEGVGLWEYKALVITGKLMMIFTLNIFFMSVNNNNLMYLTMFLSQSTNVGRNYFQYSNNKITFLRNY